MIGPKVKDDKQRDAKVKEIEKAVKAGIDYQKKKMMLSKSKKTNSQRSNLGHQKCANIQNAKNLKKSWFLKII